MKPIHLENFVLQKSNPNNPKHCQLINDMNHENNQTGYLHILRNSETQYKSDHLYNSHYFVYNQNKVIGSLHIGNRYLLERKVYLAYGILQNNRNQSYGTNLLKEASQYLLVHHLWINKIALTIDPENQPSIHAAQKAGFQLVVPLVDASHSAEYQVTRTR